MIRRWKRYYEGSYVAGAGARSAGAARAGAVGVAAAAHFDGVVVDCVVLGKGFGGFFRT